MNCTYETCSSDSGLEMRRFLTKEEKVGMLKEYLEYLTREGKGVSERIAELEKE